MPPFVSSRCGRGIEVGAPTCKVRSLLRGNGGCNAKACFRFPGRHSLGLCDDFRGTGSGSWRGASKGTKCLRRLPTDSPLHSGGVRVAARLPRRVSRSVFLFPSLRGLWAVRRGGLLGRVYSHGMGPALISYLHRAAMSGTVIDGGVTDVGCPPAQSKRPTGRSSHSREQWVCGLIKGSIQGRPGRADPCRLGAADELEGIASVAGANVFCLATRELSLRRGLRPVPSRLTTHLPQYASVRPNQTAD